MTRTLIEQKKFIDKWIGITIGDITISKDKQEQFILNESLDYLYSILETLENRK
jgi:hypothetical protein